MWDRNFEDCDSESDEEDYEQWNLQNPGKYKAVQERQLKANVYPLTVRKLREFVAPDDVVTRVLPLDGEGPYDWYEPELHDRDSYFTLVNTKRRQISVGEEVTYCYGCRSNKFLLTHYGFCIPDNRYDSFEFFLNTNPTQKSVAFMVQQKALGAKLQSIRLKRN